MSAVRLPFGHRLAEAVAERGRLCVGIDPHPALLQAWGLDDNALGLARFADTCVRALAGEVAVLKPQVAFFEAHGSAGVRVLEDTIAAAHAAGALVLLDVKRGDIGSTMAAYARAYLGEGSSLAADAVTLSPYLGTGSLEPALQLAEATGRGVFVLARTSNPEGAPVQLATAPDGGTVAQHVVDAAAARNAGSAPGSVGVVVGATRDHGLALGGLNGPVLAPGLGAQGATAADLAAIFAGVAELVLPSTSRDVLGRGPDVAALRGAAARTRDEVAAALPS
ncbi:orotidine-5'-phosphate decarboxylase [Rhodococcus sp. X156]|uniref:orotidine-5'-phosphate decarboxylase n=1 Tax=Rhodococcus sp. X156 TaxID=2499145 RepID=UPI000FD83B6B|nr:orotidine-5'-phosphate decarboxylase [Rhodococcus sp. X156]